MHRFVEVFPKKKFPKHQKKKYLFGLFIFDISEEGWSNHLEKMESEAVSVRRPVSVVKRPKVDCDLDQIVTEIHTAAQEGRQFSLSSAIRQQLIATHGPEKVTEVIFKAIRDTNTSIVAPFDPQRDIQHLITSVTTEASISITSKQVAWSPQGSTTVYEAGEVILLTCSTNTAELSSYLSGDVRYGQKISKKSSAVAAWNDDQNLKAVILGNLTRTTNNGSALSRNNLKTSCKLYGNCDYPSSFPISAVIWILRREAERRPEKKLFRFIDPCAGWGDRAAGAILAGPTVLEHYVGIDPWTVSHDLCQRTVDKLAPKSGPAVQVSLLAKGRKISRNRGQMPILFLLHHPMQRRSVTIVNQTTQTMDRPGDCAMNRSLPATF